MSASAGGADAQSSHSAAERSDPVRVQTEFSRGFGDWLISHRVGLVCSTHQTGYLLFVGVRADGQPVPSAASFSFAMGLAASSQRIYLGTQREIWRLENILAPDGMFDRFYAPRCAQITCDDSGLGATLLYCSTPASSRTFVAPAELVPVPRLDDAMGGSIGAVRNVKQCCTSSEVPLVFRNPELRDAMQSDQCWSLRPIKICKMKRPIVRKKLPRMSQINEGSFWSASDLYLSPKMNRKTSQELRKNSRRLSGAPIWKERGDPSSIHNAV